MVILPEKGHKKDKASCNNSTFEMIESSQKKQVKIESKENKLKEYCDYLDLNLCVFTEE